MSTREGLQDAIPDLERLRYYRGLRQQRRYHRDLLEAAAGSRPPTELNRIAKEDATVPYN
jgi:hypothetical protein